MNSRFSFKYIFLVLFGAFLSISSCKKSNISISAVTGDAVDVSFNSAVLSGNVVIPGSVSGITIGAHYSLSEGMITSNSTEVIAVSPNKDYSFSVEVNGLKPNTKYYYRTFAKASDVYTFGETKSFTTIKEPTIKMLIDSASFDFMKHDGSFDIAIENPISGCSLSASTNDAWITDVKVNGNTVTYKVAENNSGAGRFGSIKVQYGLAVATYKVTQTSPALSLSPNSAETDYTSKAQSFTYSIENPMDGLSVSATSEDTWITGVKVSGNTVNYNVAENNSEATRTGLIKLTYGPVKKNFSVTQTYSATGITFSPTSQSTDYTAKSLSFTFDIINPRQGVSASVSTTETWITEVKLSGTTVSYKVAENNSGAQRTGKIKLTYGSVTKEFSVTQTYSTTSITFTPSSQSTNYTAKSLSFTFAINNPRDGATASVSTTDDWITDVRLNGTTVSYKVAENNCGASRSGQIRLTYGSMTKDFSVTQTYSAPSITFTPTSQSTDYTAKSLSFTFAISNPRDVATATVSTTDDWITDVILNGTAVSYKVAENNSGASRSGKIKLTYGSVAKDFSVTQTYSASDITFTPESQSTDYTEKSLSFTYTISNPRAGVTVSVSTTVDWITDVKLNGTTINYKVAENNSGHSHTGSIKLTYGSLTKDFSVYQTYTAPVIRFTPTSQTTDYTAKSLSFQYSIDTPRQGATASVSTTSTWITNVQISGNTVSYLIAENNGTAKRTGEIVLSYEKNARGFIVTQENNVVAVDLGLSVKWASCNVGASTPEGSGRLYQWAGTTALGSSTIVSIMNCPYHTKQSSDSRTGWTKYVPSDKSSYWSGTGSPDNKTVLDLSDDAANVKWGGSWRMPTDAEWTELRSTDNCSWTWTSIKGVYGYKVQSKKAGYTGNWIFLPAAGYLDYDEYCDDGDIGRYWSSSLCDDPAFARSVEFYSSQISREPGWRYEGMSVRPVKE